MKIDLLGIGLACLLILFLSPVIAALIDIGFWFFAGAPVLVTWNETRIMLTLLIALFAASVLIAVLVS